jgi:asparagine synthase (glutamine-hydrolysing)
VTLCGIAGFIVSSGLPGKKDTLLGMLARLKHRGPDAEGVWNEDNVWLGHRRLAIVDITPTGAQPMLSRSGRYVIIYNGEIYNFGTLRMELERDAPTKWRGTSDTEVLIELIDRVGLKQALLRANGMFALAVWDRKEKTLSLARDRFGEKPLFYAVHGGGIAFASELTALEAMSALPREIDNDVVVSYLENGNVPSPLSIYRGIHKLPPASFVEFSEGRISEVEFYWSIANVAQNGQLNLINDDTEMVDRLEQALMRSCREKMVSDVPLGAFLSGGIDSSTIVALMQKQSSRAIKTFTIGFDISNYNEASYARAVAQHLGTDHSEQILTAKDAIDLAPGIGGVYDEPFADASAIPTYLVSKMARSKVTVCLSGDGGDELFAGYARYFMQPDIWKRIERFPLRRMVGRVARALPSSVLTSLFSPFKSRLSQYGNKTNPIGAKIQRLAEHLDFSNFEDYYASTMRAIPNAAKFVLGTANGGAAKTDYPIKLSSRLDWMCFQDSVDYLPNDVLAKVDRAGMAFSLEGRMPILDPEVAEIAWRIPSNVKTRDGSGKWPLRQVLHRHVPKHLFDRPKMGFGIPLREWLGGPLDPWVQDLLSEDRLRRQGLLDVSTVRACLDDFTTGRRPEPTKLWTLLMLQSWLEARGR